MDRTFSFQTHHQTIPTLQSIDAQSQISVDIKQQQIQHLASKIFMLCLQLERKHKIIEQLQNEAQKDQMKKSQIDITHRDLNGRYQRLTKQYHLLIQTNGVLKNQLNNKEKIIADLEIHKIKSAYNKELEDKVIMLEGRLQKAEQQKIQLIEKQKNLRRENSMLSYSANKTVQKNRIKDLQNQLALEKSKLQNEKRIIAELRFQNEKAISEVRQLRETQITTIKKYEQKIQRIQFSKQNEDLRQSQFVAANQEKIALLSQQLNRIKQELDYSRNLLREEKQKSSSKELQMNKIMINISSYENQVKNYQGNNKELEDRLAQMEGKLKKAEQQKGQYIQRENNLKRENSLLTSHSVNKTKNLQNELAQEKSKLQQQRRNTADLKYQIQKITLEIRQLRENQIITIKKYQQKIQRIQFSKQNQDLRQSQCVAANEQKIALLSQQLNRVNQELSYLRNLLREEKQKLSSKELQINKLMINIDSYENEVKNYQNNNAASHQQNKKIQEQLLSQIQSYEKTIKSLKLAQTDLQNFLKQKISSQNQLKIQTERFRAELQEVENEKNTLKNELRKLKRKTISDGTGECQICKIRSAATIFSGKNILENRAPMDLQQIIKQTQKLNMSNKKIQNLINHHQMTSQHSLQIRSNISRTIINTSQ